MKSINEIKSLCAQKGLTLTYVAEKMSERLGKKYTINNLSKKLNTETIRYSEIKIIADILDFKIEFINK